MSSSTRIEKFVDPLLQHCLPLCLSQELKVLAKAVFLFQLLNEPFEGLFNILGIRILSAHSKPPSPRNNGILSSFSLSYIVSWWLLVYDGGKGGQDHV